VNPRIHVGNGVTGAVRYVFGEGRDPVTGELKGPAPDGKSRVEWFSGQNFGFAIETQADADLARRVMEFDALNQRSKTRKCTQDCVHISLGWRPGDKPTRQEMEATAQSSLKALGMGNARAIFVAHNDEDYAHVHIVASKINPETGRAYDLERSQRKLSDWALGYEREHGGVICTRREAASELRNAIRDRDAEVVLGAMTKQRATFTAAQLEHALAKEIRDPAARAGFTSQIIAHAQTVGLADKPGGDITRYTTRTALEAEQYVLRSAAGLALDTRHHIGDRTKAAVLNSKRFEGISREQVHAFRHATRQGGLALIDGQSGTGKSFTVAAIREAYEKEGYRVIGLAQTNAVAQDMRGAGFNRSATVHSELFALNNNRTSWNDKTVVIVDEAAMIDTRLMAMVTAHAHDAHAKLILVGDDRQLSSIDRGGMFGTLKDRHGAAELTEVRRQFKLDERRASEMMAEGNFHDALGIYQQKGAIHWTRTQGEARGALVHQWAQDTVTHPEKSRFVFAYTNDDVAALNAALRGVRQARGELGADHQINTAHGKLDFATGDRIQFTATDKRAGIFTGAAGRIEKIAGAAITVQLDGSQTSTITFDAGAFNKFRHGYAGTIYRGQGRTLDQTYLYHSEHWRSAASYVALTRHRDKTAMFVARNTAKDIKELARQMGRIDDRRAASMFHHDLDIGPVRPLTAKEILERLGGAEFRPRDGAAYKEPAFVKATAGKQAAAENVLAAEMQKQTARRQAEQKRQQPPAQKPQGQGRAKRRWWQMLWPSRQDVKKAANAQTQGRQPAGGAKPAPAAQEKKAAQSVKTAADWMAAELERMQKARDAPDDDNSAQRRRRRTNSL
jgi:Ti-type conjugative transfer relaxase TraA